jgi:hypothetical protein
LTAGAEPASWGAEEIMDLFDLSGKVAVVTGGNGGIGLAMAAGMAEAGASILVAGRDAAKSVDAVAALKETGAQADRFELDVTDEDACRALMQAAADRFGRLDILVNNAGMSIRKRPELYTLAEWKQVIETNLTSAFICCQAAHPHMKRAGGGKIISIGSMYSLFGAPVGAPYAASKGGPQRPGACPDAGRALGRTRRPQGRRGVSRECGVELRDRGVDPGRRRVCDQRVTDSRALSYRAAHASSGSA